MAMPAATTLNTAAPTPKKNYWSFQSISILINICVNEINTR